jgi:tRNA dimethylallyltransferase
MGPKELIVICGPTASGKSYLGHYLAKKLGGEIVNCDSMQVYKQIPIITASPPKMYQDEIPYHLYNFLPVDQEFSVIKYVNSAYEKIKEITSSQKMPIIVGGTGLYVNSLLFGYNEIPEITPDIRQHVRKLHTNLGQIEIFNRLKELDSIAGEKLNPADTQRVLRGYEVFLQTGKSIFTFQAEQKIPILPNFNYTIIFLHPQREFLYHTCNVRLQKIFLSGAIEEITKLHLEFPDLQSSAMKTIGIQEIISYLDDKNSLQQAMQLAQIKTRQYAKRQITWFKNQIKDKITLEYSDNQQFKELANRLLDRLSRR